MSGDKGGAAAGKGVECQAGEEGESPGLPRAGGLGSAEALRGAPSWGRAQRVSGCRSRAASQQLGDGPRPEEGSRSWAAAVSGRSKRVPTRKGHPEEFGETRGGPLSPPVLKVLSSSCLSSP